MSKGKLIVLEGLDGSGKATQAKLLAAHLKERGFSVREITFPNYESDSSALVKMYLAGQFGQHPDDVNAYAKDLVKRGLAYPCFCTEEELEEVRKKQEEDKAMTGYYGKYAVCRNLTLEDIEAKLKAGLTYVLRLRSAGSPDKEIVFHDRIMGEIKLPENIHDIVLLKRDGVPTYHFAHAIDDHLMRTTMVIRGGEWLASVPTHYELFHVLGFKMPSYGHTAHLMKFDEETGGKRKLSKRKDPELSLDYYRKDGYHPMAMKVYLLTLLNSNFEEWYEKFPDKDIKEFPFSVEKMSQSGALFDKDKLHNICKNELAKLPKKKCMIFFMTGQPVMNLKRRKYGLPIEKRCLQF